MEPVLDVLLREGRLGCVGGLMDRLRGVREVVDLLRTSSCFLL